MTTLKQEQQQKSIEAADTDKPYEWSYIRVAEGVITNVVSATIIGLWAIILGALYGTWVLVLSALHTPSGLIGIVALILLGAMLMLLILVVAIVAWFRGTSSTVLLWAFFGAMIGAVVGTSIDAAERKRAQEQKNTAKPE